MTQTTPAAMTQADRKAALAGFRDRKPAIGIYALRCPASGQVWVGSTPNLGTVFNRHRFTLAQGAHPNATLQAAAKRQGPDGIGFDVLEQIDTETPDAARATVLKDRLAHWIGELNATRL